MGNNYRSVLANGGAQPTGDAVAADVLTGKTFSNASAVGVSGTMPNNGAVSGTVAPGESYTIPAGYHNGSGTVTGRAITPTKLDDGYSAALPNTKSISLGAGSHTIMIVAASFNTNISMTGDTPVTATFNGTPVTVNEIAFTDESAHDVFTGYITVEGSGTLIAGITTTAATSNRNTTVQVIEL